MLKTLRLRQYCDGLSVNNNSFQYSFENNKVIIQLRLQNNDTFDYYYLDPEETGMELFHYYTNGLIIRDFINKKTYTHKITATQPEPWDSWKMEWLSLIESNEYKLITLSYENFEIIPTGELKAFFRFPGLMYQVDREDIQQNNGRIWLGEIQSIKEIKIE